MTSRKAPLLPAYRKAGTKMATHVVINANAVFKPIRAESSNVVRPLLLPFFFAHKGYAEPTAVRFGECI